MRDKQEEESKLPVHKYKLRIHNDGAREKKGGERERQRESDGEREREKIFKKGEHERKWWLWLRESLIRG